MWDASARQRVRADEGGVAVKHDHLAVEPVQQRQRLRDRVPGAELLFLKRHLRVGVELADRARHRLGAMARDDDHTLGVQCPARGQRVADQRHATQPVKNLGQVRKHPAALPGRKHHQGHCLFRHAAISRFMFHCRRSN